MPPFPTVVGLVAAGLLAVAGNASAQTPGAPAEAPVTLDDPVVLVVHGGAGSLRPGVLSAAAEAELRASVEGALRAGHAALVGGGPSAALDAVEDAITRLEDDPQFNAGRGAVLAADGTARHDASIMDGRTGGAGASAGTMHVRHPITLARRVMDASPHVLLTGDGAEAFAREQALEMVDNEWFITDDARRTLEAVQQREREQRGELPPSARTGTVGAVALGADGSLAAGTSTGGMTNKRWGRVGDSPIVGAGTWADGACAVSATGHGEYFIRLGVARDIAARVAYLGEPCADAARHVIGRTLTDAGGTGGVIALGADGVASMPFNTSGMSRGTITRSGVVRVYLYADDE